MSNFSFHRFFAGGSEHSGQQIVGPPKKKGPNELVEDLFKGAKEHGAVPVDKPGKGHGESSKSSKVDSPLNKLYCKDACLLCTHISSENEFDSIFLSVCLFYSRLWVVVIDWVQHQRKHRLMWQERGDSPAVHKM